MIASINAARRQCGLAARLRLIELGFRQGGPAGYGLRRVLIDQSGSVKGQLSRGEHKSLQTDRVILQPGPDAEVTIVNQIYRWFVEDGLFKSEIGQKMRLALGIESRDGIDDLGDGVWRLGDARRSPVLLARNLARVLHEPALLDRVRVVKVTPVRANARQPPAGRASAGKPHTGECGMGKSMGRKANAARRPHGC